jgi:hypothetical protein
MYTVQPVSIHPEQSIVLVVGNTEAFDQPHPFSTVQEIFSDIK